MLVSVTLLSVSVPVEVRMPLELPVMSPFIVIPPVPTFVVRFCVQVAIPLMVSDSAFPELPFMVIVCPLAMVTSSTFVGTRLQLPADVHVPAVPQFPVATDVHVSASAGVVKTRRLSENSHKNKITHIPY